MTAAASADTELVISRLFDAPRALVFRMWTDPAHAVRWWGPRHHPAVELHMDVRPGGQWRNCLRSVETGDLLWQHGMFREVAPPERLVFTFQWDEEGERGLETLVTVTFADEGGKTRLVMRQSPFVSAGERDGHTEGWSSTFERLSERLSEHLEMVK